MSAGLLAELAFLLDALVSYAAWRAEQQAAQPARETTDARRE